MLIGLLDGTMEATDENVAMVSDRIDTPEELSELMDRAQAMLDSQIEEIVPLPYDANGWGRLDHLPGRPDPVDVDGIEIEGKSYEIQEETGFEEDGGRWLVLRRGEDGYLAHLDGENNVLFMQPH
jgi:hypothetical protein